MKRSVSDRHRHLESYLSMENIISATVVSPGQTPFIRVLAFCQRTVNLQNCVSSAELPLSDRRSNVIAKLGNKQEARNTMEAAGVPVIPGSKEASL